MLKKVEGLDMLEEYIYIPQHEIYVLGTRVLTFILATLDLLKPLVKDKSFMRSDQVHSGKSISSLVKTDKEQNLQQNIEWFCMNYLCGL